MNISRQVSHDSSAHQRVHVDGALSETGLVVSEISHSYRDLDARHAGRRGRTRVRRPVLDRISFTVPPGTLTALIGPSGCGKSTLLRILAGLEVSEQGRAYINGRSIVGTAGAVAYHPQQDALFPWLTTLDNATLGAQTCGQDRATARTRARAELERFGLAGVEQAWPDELSGGMRQRVALLRSTLMPQPVLVLDEPFGALDALTRRRLQVWLADITASDQRPTLLVTHDIEEALLLADQVLVLSPRPARIVHVEQRPDAQTRRQERESGDEHVAAQRILAALETGVAEAAAAATPPEATMEGK